MPFVIHGVTVSCSFSDKEYGKGQEFFENISAKARDDMNGGGYELERLNEVIDSSLDMFFAAWKSVLTQRLVVGQIDGTNYKSQLAASTERIEKVRRFLNKNHEPFQPHS